MRRVLIGGLLALVTAAPALAQNFAPPQAAPRRIDAPMATICSTDWGWCPIRAVGAPGAACSCFVPPSTYLPGSARYFPYEGPVSPYLNPHTAPPSTLR